MLRTCLIRLFHADSRIFHGLDILLFGYLHQIDLELIDLCNKVVESCLNSQFWLNFVLEVTSFVHRTVVRRNTSTLPRFSQRSSVKRRRSLWLPIELLFCDANLFPKPLVWMTHSILLKQWLIMRISYIAIKLNQAHE